MSVREILAGKAVVEIGLRNRIEKGLKAVSGRLRRFSSNLRSLSGAFTATGGAAMAGLGGPLTLIGAAFASFDGKMAEVAAIAGVSGKALDQLRDKAKDLGATTRFSATEAAEAMKFLGMAGMNSTQILSAIDPVLNVAAAGMLDLGRASDIVSDATTAFGLSAEQTARVADVMAKTATSSNTSIEQMGDAFTYAAAQGKAAGQTVEDVSAALGVLGNSGLKASVAGSGVQGIFKRMITPEATKQLRSLGVSIADASGRIRPLNVLMSELRDRTAGMTQIKRLQTFEGIFGLHAKSALVLATNADQLSKLTGELYGAQGAASDMASAMQNSLMGSLLSLSSAGQSILIELGEALKEPATFFIGSIIQIARATSQFIKANQPLFKILSLVALGIMAVGGALFALGGIGLIASLVVSGLASALTMAATAIGFMMGPGGTVLVILAALAGAAYYFRDAIMQLLAPLLPTFSAIRDAVAHFGQIFMQTWSGALAAMSQGDLGKAGTIAMAGLSAALWTGVADVAKVVSSMLDLLTGWLPGLDTIRDYASQVFGSIGESILAGRWDLAGHILMTKLQLVVESGWASLKFLWVAVSQDILSVFDQMASGIRSVWRSAVFEIAKWIGWIGEKLGVVGGGTQEMLEQMRSEAQSSDDRATARREAARREKVQKAMQSTDRERELEKQLALLEQESAASYTAAGAPTLDDRAAKAREELAQAITSANEKAAEQGAAPEDVGAYQSAAAGGVKQASKMTSTGTFSAAAASLMGLGTSKAAEKTASNTGKQVMLTRKLLKQHAAQPKFGT